MVMRGAIRNASRVYSPVMLNNEWPKIGRLLFTVVSSVISVIMNGFFVASFFVENSLNRRGFVFMACFGVSDVFISTTVLPTSAVVLLSGEWDNDLVCYALQFIATASTYSYSLFFAMVSIETYYRICKATKDYGIFTFWRVTAVLLLIFAVSFATAGAGVYLEMDYDYCHRRYTGNHIFQVSTGVIFFVIPFFVTIFGFLNASCRMSDKASKFTHYKRSQQYELDNCRNNLNMAAYLLYIVAWIPYLSVVHMYPDASDSWYYNSAWLGVYRSVLTSFIYGCIDTSFRRAYAYLFNYCCCKSTLSGSFATRHRRAMEYKGATGDVRVHIMHQVVNSNSPQRGGSSTRETQEL